MPQLSIFTLTPSSPPTDARWQGVRFGGEVVVRAQSPEDARAVAAEARRGRGCRFRDPSLYRVREVNYGDAFREGRRGVIARLMPPAEEISEARAAG